MTSIETIHPVIETTEGCRYCLMCRHICPVTRVTFNEATSPHGWALAVASVRRGQLAWNDETVDLLYQCADCGLCQAHCATDQPLPDAIVAARAAIVAAGLGPRNVSLATQLNGTLDAARALLKAAGVDYPIFAPEHDVYLAYTLGEHNTARELAQSMVGEIAHGGARTLVTLAPDDTHTLVHVFPQLGAPLPDGIAVIELTTLLMGMVEDGRLKVQRGDFDVAYHDPCQTPRFEGRWNAPRRLLSALTERPIQEGFWREGRAAPCGASGGLPATQPELAAKLARAALADATRGGTRMIVTEAPRCLAHLRAHADDGVEVKGLYELLIEGLETRD